MVFGIPPIVMLITYVLRRSNADLWYSFLTISLTYGLSANTTDAIKAIVGTYLTSYVIFSNLFIY